MSFRHIITPFIYSNHVEYVIKEGPVLVVLCTNICTRIFKSIVQGLSLSTKMKMLQQATSVWFAFSFLLLVSGKVSAFLELCNQYMEGFSLLVGYPIIITFFFIFSARGKTILVAAVLWKISLSKIGYDVLSHVAKT